jgi:hypothetical protein
MLFQKVIERSSARSYSKHSKGMEAMLNTGFATMPVRVMQITPTDFKTWSPNIHLFSVVNISQSEWNQTQSSAIVSSP